MGHARTSPCFEGGLTPGSCLECSRHGENEATVPAIVFRYARSSPSRAENIHFGSALLQVRISTRPVGQVTTALGLGSCTLDAAVGLNLLRHLPPAFPSYGKRPID